MIDNTEAFRQKMIEDGLLPPDDFTIGVISRFPGAGKGKGNKAGWYKLFPDGLGGIYGDHSSNLSKTWQADEDKSFTPAEKSAFNKQVEESRKQAKLEREKYHAATALKAVTTYENAKGNPSSHPYTIKKGVNLGGLVLCGAWPQRSWNDALIIPLYDRDGKITSIQAINTDGTKDFLSGGRISGCFHPIGKIRGATGLIVIGEGLATVAAVCEVMGCSGVVAFSAGNLNPVTREIRLLAPDADIIILADDDQNEGGMNPGMDAALKTVTDNGCKVATPGMGKKADFHDVLHELAADGIRARMAAATSISIQSLPENSWFKDAVKNGSVARFIDNPKPILDFIFEDSLLAATVGLLVGPGAVGKSTLSIMLLMAIATGRDILPGIFTPTRAGKVLGVFAEDCEEVLHRRFKEISDELFFSDPEAQNLLRENMAVVSAPGRDLRLFNDDQRKAETAFFQTVNEITQSIDGLRLLVIDPLSRFHGENENDNSAGTFFISLLERIAQTTKAAVLCCHHVGKFVSSDSKGNFNLDAAMAQDAARGASGLTNGARWQCNLSGIPEKDAEKLLGIKNAKPDQYLALRVSKKNYGKPEPVHFLERGYAGILQPVEPVASEVDTKLGEVIKELLIKTITAEPERKFTRKMLKDGKLQEWKNVNPKITKTAIEENIENCLLVDNLFERSGRNGSGKTIKYLSLTPEPATGEPAGEPAELRTGKPAETGKIDLPVHNMPDLQEKLNRQKQQPANDTAGSVSARNYGTVEPAEITPYGGDISPAGLTALVIPQDQIEDDNAEFF